MNMKTLLFTGTITLVSAASFHLLGNDSPTSRLQECQDYADHHNIKFTCQFPADIIPLKEMVANQVQMHELQDYRPQPNGAEQGKLAREEFEAKYPELKNSQ